MVEAFVWGAMGGGVSECEEGEGGERAGYGEGGVGVKLPGSEVMKSRCSIGFKKEFTRPCW